MRTVIALLMPFAWLAPSARGAEAATAPAAATANPEPRETIRLWEGDAPGALGAADHDVPTIAWWPTQAPTPTAALVICPGGGYGGLADHEGRDYARWLTGRGF